MANVWFGERRFDADLIVFDKDGTLIDFAEMWGSRIDRSLTALAGAIEADIILRGRLYYALGYDPEARAFVSQSPAITAPMHEMYTIPALVLYQHGYGWLDAQLLVERHYRPVMDAPIEPHEIRPTADLRGLFAALRRAGIHIGVVTSDDRAPTLETLARLELVDYVGFVACADDPYPGKPAPDGLLAACRHLGVDPIRAAMVGDSTTDLVMARRAGVGLAVGVLTGVMDAPVLAPVADVVLNHVGEIKTD